MLSLEGAPAQPPGNAWSNAARGARSPLCSKGASVARVPPDVHPSRQALPAKPLSRRVAPSSRWCLGLLRPRDEEHLCFSRWSFVRFQVLQPVPVPLDGSRTLWGIGHSSQFGPKLSNRAGTKTDPWGTCLVAALRQDLTPPVTTLCVPPCSQFSVHLPLCSSSPNSSKRKSRGSKTLNHL